MIQVMSSVYPKRAEIHTAGPESLPFGSLMIEMGIFDKLISLIWVSIIWACSLLQIMYIRICSTWVKWPIVYLTLNNVFWSIENRLVNCNNCLGSFSLDFGQRREPDPPHKITKFIINIFVIFIMKLKRKSPELFYCIFYIIKMEYTIMNNIYTRYTQ